MSDNSLFRKEAFDAKKTKLHGEIVMVAPLRYGVMAAASTLVAFGFALFAIWGSYTKRVTVTGQLVPSRGVMKVYAPQTGTVLEDNVKEGQSVHTGEVLFVLSSERQSLTRGNTQATISEETRQRQASMQMELAKLKRMQSIERQSLVEKVAAFGHELTTLSALITDQSDRYSLAAADYSRYQGVESTGYVTHDQVAQRQADRIDQKTKLETLERERITTERNLGDARYQLDSLAIKYDNQMADITRNIEEAEQDLSESEARRQLVIVAPCTGAATAITVHGGQVVDTSKPLVSIIPANSLLEVELYAPSRSVGFVKPGDVVWLRYQAYPYQKFGQYRGVVLDIAKTALSSTELTGTNIFAPAMAQASEPLYQVSVRIDSQNIRAYGASRPLHAGMLLEADLLQDRRKLYQWALEPLYALGRGL